MNKIAIDRGRIKYVMRLIQKWIKHKGIFPAGHSCYDTIYVFAKESNRFVSTMNKGNRFYPYYGRERSIELGSIDDDRDKVFIDTILFDGISGYTIKEIPRFNKKYYENATKRLTTDWTGIKVAYYFNLSDLKYMKINRNTAVIGFDLDDLKTGIQVGSLYATLADYLVRYFGMYVYYCDKYKFEDKWEYSYIDETSYIYNKLYSVSIQNDYNSDDVGILNNIKAMRDILKKEKEMGYEKSEFIYDGVIKLNGSETSGSEIFKKCDMLRELEDMFNKAYNMYAFKDVKVFETGSRLPKNIIPLFTLDYKNFDVYCDVIYKMKVDTKERKCLKEFVRDRALENVDYMELWDLIEFFVRDMSANSTSVGIYTPELIYRR